MVSALDKGLGWDLFRQEWGQAVLEDGRGPGRKAARVRWRRDSGRTQLCTLFSRRRPTMRLRSA